MVASGVVCYGVYVADLDPVRGREIAKKRPVVVVSQDEMNLHSDTIAPSRIETPTASNAWFQSVLEMRANYWWWFLPCAGRSTA